MVGGDWNSDPAKAGYCGCTEGRGEIKAGHSLRMVLGDGNGQEVGADGSGFFDL
jgi:hypothetical protein